MNVVLRGSAELLDELIAAADGAAPAVRKAACLARIGDVAALDALTRLAERFEGARRHAMLACDALRRERETSR